MNRVFWRRVFAFKAGWNMLVSAGLFISEPWLRNYFHLTDTFDSTYQQLFLALAFIFGIGYLWVSKDLSANRAIVVLGVLGQGSVFIISVYHYGSPANPLEWVKLGAGCVDLTFAILFARFLYLQGKPEARHG